MKSSSIQEGMLIFIVNFVQNNKDEAELMKCFKALDLNSDGVLSMEELKQGLLKYLKLKDK
jgi:Ca2+-binding EF-hand superfamily protein